MFLLHDVIPDSPLFLIVLLNVAAIPVLAVAAIVAFIRKKTKWAAFHLFSLSLLCIGVGVFSQSDGATAIPVWLVLNGVIAVVWWKFVRGPA